MHDFLIPPPDPDIHALGLQTGTRVEEIVRDVDVPLPDYVHHFKVKSTEHAREGEVELGVGQVQSGAHPGSLAKGNQVALQAFLVVFGQPAVRVEDGRFGINVGVVVDQDARHCEGRSGRNDLAMKG